MMPPRLTAAARLAREQSERSFQEQIIALATLSGWLVHAERPAWTSQGWRTAIQGRAGFPDLVLVRGGMVVFAELKRMGGRPTSAQQGWLDALRASPGVKACLWTPADWPEIERTLVL